MLIPLILCILGFLFLSIWFTLVRYRVELLKEDSKRPWVKELASVAEIVFIFILGSGKCFPKLE